MGRQRLYVVSYGKTAGEAFRKAMEDARWKSGHAGYVGTIAEKNGFTIVDAPCDPNTFVEAVNVFHDTSTSLLGEQYRSLVYQATMIYEGKKHGHALCVPTSEKNKDGELKFIFTGLSGCP